MMKSFLLISAAGTMLLLPGCTSVISTYDHNGKLVKVEKATNFSRAMDGTNSKSQMLLIDFRHNDNFVRNISFTASNLKPAFYDIKSEY